MLNPDSPVPYSLTPNATEVFDTLHDLYMFLVYLCTNGAPEYSSEDWEAITFYHRSMVKEG